ncbi:uncharacterized protein METZ01_LOCUS408939, partial [marine metagenome]
TNSPSSAPASTTPCAMPTIIFATSSMLAKTSSTFAQPPSSVASSASPNATRAWAF